MKPLFIGLGATAPSWYRCALPAMTMGADWVGTFRAAGGPLLAGNIQEVNHDFYDIIVCQQPSSEESLKFIRERKKAGQKVVFEIDDFIHGVRKIEGHSFQKAFHKKRLKLTQEIMGECDAMICSTQYLSDQYKKYNPNQYVSPNGIPTEKYNVERGDKEFVTIGWSGGTGHHKAIGPWLEAVLEVMRYHDDVAFVSIGVDYASIIEERFPNRTISVPWSTIENYPYALTNIDIGIAPSHDSKYFKSKSNLRWLEYSAANIPLVADSRTYPDVIDGNTGFLATAEKQVFEKLDTLASQAELRKEIAEQAKEAVIKDFDISVTQEAWKRNLQQILNA